MARNSEHACLGIELDPKYVDVIVRRRRGVSAKAALIWAGWQGLRPEARKARRSSAGAGKGGVRCYGLMR